MTPSMRKVDDGEKKGKKNFRNSFDFFQSEIETTKIHFGFLLKGKEFLK